MRQVSELTFYSERGHILQLGQHQHQWTPLHKTAAAASLWCINLGESVALHTLIYNVIHCTLLRDNPEEYKLNKFVTHVFILLTFLMIVLQLVNNCTKLFQILCNVRLLLPIFILPRSLGHKTLLRSVGDTQFLSAAARFSIRDFATLIHVYCHILFCLA